MLRFPRLFSLIMRIALDIRPMLEQQRCGVSLYTTHIVQELCRNPKHEYRLFCNTRTLAIPGDVPPEGSGVCHSFFRYPNKFLNASIASTRRPLMESLVNDVDAVYLPNLNFVSTKKPLIATVHDLSFLRYPQYFSAKQQLWHKLVNPIRTLKSSAAVVTVSQHTKDDVMELFGIPEKRIKVVHPAVSQRYFDISQEKISTTRSKFELHRPYFLFLGALEPRKNIGALIAAFERIGTDTELVIAGGKGWLYKTIFERARRSPANDRIRFLGYVPEELKPGLYGGALAFVYPSFYEGFGMPPLESMAAGTPVISSNATSLGEVVGDAGLLADPHDVTSLTDAMVTILREPNLRADLIARGRERARKFTWQEGARRLEKVFDSIAT